MSAAGGFPAPAPEDERAHAAGDEQLWNESWYFDAVAEDGSLGAYIRLGLYPNLGVAWYTAFVTGPGRPAVAVIDLAAPLPADDRLTTQTDAIRAEHRCEQPLERFAVTLAATGEAHDDHSAPLRGEAGAPVEVALDLAWETDGLPYAYPMTTRYEIPCHVAGTIRLAGETLELRGSGQRDHSWGVRDWWAFDWMWSAVRLGGDRVHAVQIRLPDGSGFGVGYVQPRDGQPQELTAVEASEEVGPDGLVTAASLALEPGALAVAVEPLAFGALRLEAPDGRTTSFPRAMCRVRASDGRTGLGWLEWNLNQRS